LVADSISPSGRKAPGFARRLGGRCGKLGWSLATEIGADNKHDDPLTAKYEAAENTTPFVLGIEPEM